jgi:hypothetical protein
MSKKKVQNNSKKKGKIKGYKKPNKKRRKDNKTLSQKAKKGQRKKLNKRQ